MAIIWTDTDTESKVNGVKILVYGDSGMGKTMLCATAPAPLVISAESGLLSLSKANIERTFGVGQPGITYNIPVMKIASMDDLLDAYRWTASDAVKSGFRTVCLDSLTEMAEQILNNMKKKVKDPRQAYGELITQMDDCVRSFRDLPGINVYMAAKMEPYKNELTGRVAYIPSMPGSKLGPKLAYFYDEVGRIGTARDKDGKTYRYLQMQPDEEYVAKDRSGALAPVEYPHLGSIFQKIIGV